MSNVLPQVSREYAGRIAHAFLIDEHGTAYEDLSEDRRECLRALGEELVLTGVQATLATKMVEPRMGYAVSAWVVVKPGADRPYASFQPPTGYKRKPGAKVYRIWIPLPEPWPVDGVITVPVSYDNEAGSEAASLVQEDEATSAMPGAAGVRGG